MVSMYVLSIAFMAFYVSAFNKAARIENDQGDKTVLSIEEVTYRDNESHHAGTGGSLVETGNRHRHGHDPERGQYHDVMHNSEDDVGFGNKSSKEETDTKSSDVSQITGHDSSTATPADTQVHLTTSCPKCTHKQTEKREKVELLKNHILGKLGLTSAPEVGGPLPPLPFDFYMGKDFAIDDDSDEVNGVAGSSNTPVTKEIFVYGTDITDKCYKRKGTGCYGFNISQEIIDPNLVSSIELWVYKQKDKNDISEQTFMVSELEPTIRHGRQMLRFRNIVKRMDTRMRSGWMKIYVKRSVLRWLTKPHRNHGLAIVCKTCYRQNHKAIYGDKEGHGPIMVFYMKRPGSTRRQKRTTSCIEGGNNCCHKEALEINFRDIGWDYIMAPSRIRPNFCTGSCNGITAAFYNHTRVVQMLRQQTNGAHAQIQTCCSPIAFERPQSLLYQDHMGVVRKVEVPDLIVGDCGCM